MSFYSFKSKSDLPIKSRKRAGSVRTAFSKYLIEKYGEGYKKRILVQRTRKNALRFRSRLEGLVSDKEKEIPVIGIIGGGFAGLYAGLILQSLGIECEVFETSDRVGGRIDTWYSAHYDAADKNKAGLYGEVGGMRVPQFAEDMLPVQQLTVALNAVLKRNGMSDKMVKWRKFYYNSEVQRLRYNNMKAPITAVEAGLNSLNFGKNKGGDLPMVWVTEKTAADGTKYLPVNMILEQVNGKFIKALDESFEKGFDELMLYDNYSMWGYLTNVFTLDQMGAYYDPAMGAKTDNLPYSVASYLETVNVGTGMYAVSFVEMVIAVYDWSGSKNSYDPDDPNVYMVTVDKGMQHFPDACREVLNLQQGVLPDDGKVAQIYVGLESGDNGKKGIPRPTLPGMLSHQVQYHQLILQLHYLVFPVPQNNVSL